ncbi:T9SS type A sorting domain-containing protein [Pontibacter chinhatensis]|uniref:Por secretion system C-terminal sorting domain-containing protein n=1 Tax=Pontibacter chinhatensis TaxID=1436961 RepID=A0A1I2UEQ8_9BACT|nr:T9SS type A sorting domain-containing protein [Pontibacter chinhatensis]SFG75662.1 Por secretion system C-terminal sorting domain-containing protein [Pontibacter chinhatensis]
MKVYLPLLLILLSLSGAVAQQEPLRFRMSQNIPVTAPAGALLEPWSGGLNAPQFSTIDLNRDGQDDLFAYDRQTAKVYTWLAVQEAGQWKYRYAPEYESAFPGDLAYWVLLRDYNCDGLKDIFTNSPLGIRVFRQEPGEPLRFTQVTDGLRYRSGRVNMQMNATDIPAITDIDGDGDLDILLTNFSQGYHLELYLNMQTEQGLPCESLVYEQQSNWWGGITECEHCNDFKFGEKCGNTHGQSIAAPLHSGHEGSTHLLLDMDGDGDMELVMGGVACENLVLMENKGDRQNALMDSFLPNFPAANPASFNLFPAAFYEDVTFDGIPDLLVSTQAFEEIHDMDFQRSSWLYRNTGAADKPGFTFVQDNFLQGQMIDLSEGAYPAFADLDGDGDLDMLVGNDASYRSGTYSGSLSFYRNTGTSSEPAFELVTHDFLSLHSKQLYSIKPTFADMNGDGKTDLILALKGAGIGSSRIIWLRNLAATGQPPAYDFAQQQELLKVADGDSPAFADLDGDGDLDLLLGKSASNLEFYRNTGTVTAPVYTLENSSFGGISFDFDRRHLHPLIFDIDGDGKLDLLTADDSGELRIYRHITQDLNATFTPETELLENKLTQQVQATRLGRGLSIAAAPLGGDEKMYLVLGSKGGGLYLLEQVSGFKGAPNAGEKLTLQVYPNPHDKAVAEPVKVHASEPVQLEVFDVVGKRVYRKDNAIGRSHTLPAQKWQAGIYIVRATAENGKQASVKLMVR